MPESRVIADLLLGGVVGPAWQNAIVGNNVLQVRNPATAIRVARLIRKRLELMQPDLWRLVRDGGGDVSTHAVLAAAVKHSHLLGDFLSLVLREQYRTFKTVLSRSLWDDYLQDCRGRDPQMPLWNASTIRKLQTTIFHVLVQAGYLNDTRSLKLQAVHIAKPVLDYLKKHDESYVLRCIQVGP